MQLKHGNPARFTRRFTVHTKYTAWLPGQSGHRAVVLVTRTAVRSAFTVRIPRGAGVPPRPAYSRGNPVPLSDVNAKFTPHSPSRTTPTTHCTALNCTHSEETINPGVMYVRHLSLAPRPGDIATSPHAASIVATAGVYKPSFGGERCGGARTQVFAAPACRKMLRSDAHAATHTRARSHYADGSKNRRRSSSEMADRSG